MNRKNTLPFLTCLAVLVGGVTAWSQQPGNLVHIKGFLVDRGGTPVKGERVWAFGYIDKTGKMAIEPRYTGAADFSEGLGSVIIENHWAYIDQQGTVKISNSQFEEAGEFHGGFAKVRAGGKWGFIDKSGKWIAEPQFEMAEDFSEGMARIAAERPDSPGRKKKKLGWGYIDTTGKVVIAPQFYEAGNFSHGLAMVRRTGGETKVEMDATTIKWYRTEEVAGYIDSTGAMAISPRYREAMPFSEGLAAVKLLDGKSAYIDTTGKVVISLYKWADPFFGISVKAINFHEGLAFADSSSGFIRTPKWGFIDKTGKVAMSLDVNKASPFSDGMALVGKGKLRFTYGYVDHNGNLAIPIQYKAADDFSEGLAAVQMDKLWGYIDHSGKLVIEPKFEAASAFHDGLARVVLGK